jgi:hypothetical protein
VEKVAFEDRTKSKSFTAEYAENAEKTISDVFLGDLGVLGGE